jgi:tetratricopeptide (TPR) repeat protein
MQLEIEMHREPSIEKTNEVDRQRGQESQMESLAPEIYALLSNARILMAHGERDLGLGLLRQAVTSSQSHPIILKELGDALGRMDNFSEQALIFQELIRREYTSENIIALAHSLYHLGDDDGAIQYYFEALGIISELSESHFEAYKNLGNIQLKRGDLDGAEESYHKAFAINPRSSALLVNLGTLRIQKEEYADAHIYFRQAVDMSHENDKAWVGLAIVANHFADWELAWANLLRAVEINPNNRTAVHLVGVWAWRDHRHQTAIDVINDYLSTVNLDEELSLVLINFYCASGALRTALIEIERVLAWNPEHAEVQGLRKKINRMISKA